MLRTRAGLLYISWGETQSSNPLNLCFVSRRADSTDIWRGDERVKSFDMIGPSSLIHQNTLSSKSTNICPILLQFIEFHFYRNINQRVTQPLSWTFIKESQNSFIFKYHSIILAEKRDDEYFLGQFSLPQIKPSSQSLAVSQSPSSIPHLSFSEQQESPPMQSCC